MITTIIIVYTLRIYTISMSMHMENMNMITPMDTVALTIIAMTPTVMMMIMIMLKEALTMIISTCLSTSVPPLASLPKESRIPNKIMTRKL
jgi:hypothetical protein